MKKTFLATLATGLFLVGMGGVAEAVPVLQLGAVDNSLATGYVPYTTVLPDTDTAFITEGPLLAAGVYGPNTLLLGGQYPGGLDWSADDILGDTYTAFDGKRAIVMATVFEGYGPTSSIELDGVGAFLMLDTFRYADQHYPVNQDDVDFFFFDIGDFADNDGAVPNFVDGINAADGEVKEISLSISGFDWVHFDLMALETDSQGQTKLKTSWATSANSHDVTYTTPVPEPATTLLIGLGVAGLAGVARRKKKA